MPISYRCASSMNERKRETAAMTAVAMASPLVSALVVFPTASSLATIRCASIPDGVLGLPFRAPDISKMPLALSEMGPNVSSARMNPVVARRPRPARAMPYAESEKLPPKMLYEPKMVAAMANVAQTLDSRPKAPPERISVAGPVLLACAISFTGFLSVAVKYSVIHWITRARTMPMVLDTDTRSQKGNPSLWYFVAVMLPRYHQLTPKNPTTEVRAATQNPTLIGFMGFMAGSSFPRTAQVPMIEPKTPTARMRRG